MLTILPIYEPMIYMVPYVMLLCGQIYYEGKWWHQVQVLALWFLILYSVHRWQQVVALALWLPSMAGGIHVLMFSFTGEELYRFSTLVLHYYVC
jgi:hypothetical protein